MSDIALSTATVNIDNEIDDGIAMLCEKPEKNITTNHQIDDAIHENAHNNLNDCSTNRQRLLTTNSINSNNLSIATLDENEYDSSIIDSDSDIDEMINYHDCNGKTSITKNLNSPNLCQSGILCTNNDVKPNIGSIAVQNSSDITFGNKTFYQGPVTIKQFVYDKKKWMETEQTENNNLGYVNNSTENIIQCEKDFHTSNNHSDELQKKSKCSNKRTLVSSFGAGLLVCSLLIIILTVQFNTNGNNWHSTKDKIGDGDDSRLNIPIPSSIGSDLITDSAGPLRIVSRSDWIAQPPEHELTPIDLPATRVIIAHTATENCTTQASCTFRVRMIQTYHIESRGWDDIGYNFLVGGDGAIYVGRGWNQQGAHTKGYNAKSICIAFIGTFNKIEPSKKQLIAAQKMIEEGVKLKKLTSNYNLYGHRQLIPSESPGRALYEIIKKWDHWTDEIH